MSGVHLKWFLGVVLARFALQAGFYFGLGLEVLSVDDYLRVWVVNENAGQSLFPDPIFLPLYFWVYRICGIFPGELIQNALILTWVFAGLAQGMVFLIFQRYLNSPSKSIGLSFLVCCQPIAIWVSGVPLSESLSAFLFFTTLFGLVSKKGKYEWLSAIALGALCLVRYEAWIVLLGILIFQCFDKSRKWKALLFYGLIASWGCLVFFVWQLLWAQKPFGALIFARSAAGSVDPVLALIEILETFFYSASSFLALALLVFFWWRKVSFSQRGLFFGLIFLCSFPVIAPMLGIGYSPMVYKIRLASLPSQMVSLTAILLLVNQVKELHWNKCRYLFLILFVGNMVLASRIQVELKPESIEVAHRIGKKLETLAPFQEVLVEKKDLGWAGIWGLNHGNSRIRFDRDYFHEPASFANPIWLFEKIQENHIACVVSASAKQKPYYLGQILGSAPSEWRLEWNRSKYQLWCRVSK